MNILKLIEEFKADENKLTRRNLRKELMSAKLEKKEVEAEHIEELLKHFGFKKSNVEGIYHKGYYFEPTQDEKLDIICHELAETRYDIKKTVKKMSVKIVEYSTTSHYAKEVNASSILKLDRYISNYDNVYNRAYIALYPKACELVIE